MDVFIDKKEPIISVIIPTYNRIVELERAIKSVLKQTVNDIEIIVVNDSNDEESVIKLTKKLDPLKIKYMRNQRKKGGSGARNTGILNARGKFIALLDDDDEWMPNKLEEQLKKMNRLDSTWGGCYCGFIRLERKKWKKYLSLKEGNIKKDYLLNRFPICGGSTLFFRKSALLFTKLFDEELERHQDTHFVVSFLRSFKLGTINKVLVRVNGHNFTTAKKIERSKELLFDKIKDDIYELNRKEINIFYAYHYIDLAIAFAIDGNSNMILHYFKKSISCRFSLSRKFRVKYASLMIVYINSKFGFIFNNYFGLKMK